jgi:carboxyl-terminal processing protease
MTFSINDKDYEAFSALVEGRELPYKSDSRRALEDLTKALSDEEKAALGEQLASLDKGIKDDKKSLLAANKQELTQRINADLLRRAYYADGSIAHSLPTDKCVGEAVKILGNKAEYERILSSQDTQRK